MKGLIVYHFSTYTRSYRYIPPFALFTILMVVNYLFKPKYVLDSFSFTATMLFCFMGWFTLSVFHCEDEGQKQITVRHTRKLWRYYFSLIVICLLIGLFLSVFATILPVVLKTFDTNVRFIHIVMGLLAHFSVSVLAISLSIMFTREIVKSKLLTFWSVVALPVVCLTLSTFADSIFAWIVPPVRFPLEMLEIGDELLVSIPPSYYARFAFIFCYGLLFISIFFSIIRKKEISI